MRVWEGVKESCKKKLGRSTWAGHVGENGRSKTGKESRCPESGGKVKVKKAEIAMGDYVKIDLERVEEE